MSNSPHIMLSFFVLLALPAAAAQWQLIDASGKPLEAVMVTAYSHEKTVDRSDIGYPAVGTSNLGATAITRFTNRRGEVIFTAAELAGAHSLRLRGQDYVDQTVTIEQARHQSKLLMQPLPMAQRPDHYPSNVWLSQLQFDGDQRLKKTFQLNCGFCHQQASVFMRNERTTEQWLELFQRMNSYGARLPDVDHQQIAELLQRDYRALRANPDSVPAPRRWDATLSDIEMTEWEIGDGFSQMHDFLLHPNGLVYVGDNLFDRIYAVDPRDGSHRVYKLPVLPGARNGGLLGDRFKVFPKIDNAMGVHSFALSPSDGHIFVTPSMQQALVEFNPHNGEFTTYTMEEGYYPHTIRIDGQDRVWFTLAVSSQVAMFDRTSKTFTYYDLPPRTFKEWLTLKLLPIIFWFDPDNRPQPAPDRDGNGLPMPYGIDIGSDGTVWAARLYANDIARIDPASGRVTMIDFPYQGPRRLRVDADDNLWVVAFQDSLLVKYDPRSDTFTDYPLPVVNELPYSLNVDKQRGVVWVNGNQSDTLLAMDIATEQWRVYPLPRERFFSRDIEIDEASGAVYTSNSHFPTWQSEGGIPTLLRIAPNQTLPSAP